MDLHRETKNKGTFKLFMKANRIVAAELTNANH